MSSTIDEFKNMLDPNRKKIKIDVDLQIENALELFHTSITKYNIIISKDLQCNGALIENYSGEFQQVLLNLLSNAQNILKEINGKKFIIITSKIINDSIEVSICDSAGGIKEDIINRVFEPYFTTKAQGTSIGLYMSKKIIMDNMAGTLDVCNKSFIIDEKEYYGACFTINIKY
jgi:signal transduction histidine kinase